MRSVRIQMILDTLRAVRGARDLSKETDRVADSFGETAGKGKAAGKAIDDAGDNMSDAARAAKSLDKQIEDLSQSLRGLAIAEQLTGEKFTKQIREQEAQVRRLTKSRKLLGSIGDDAGAAAAAGFLTRFTSSLASAPPVALGGGILAAAMAPTLAAGVAGAVVGAAGAGGVIGGVMLAARDPRVKMAGKLLGQFVLSDLTDRAAGFVEPTLSGIAKVRAGFAAMGPDLDRVFASSRFIDPLVDGAVSGAQKFVHGFADAVDEADPVIQSLRFGLDSIGGAAGQTFSTMAADAKVGAEGIDELTASVTNLIHATAGIIHAGAVVKGWGDTVDKVIDRGRFWVEDNSAIAESLRAVGVTVDLTADGFRVGSVQAEAYRKATMGVATAADFATLQQAGMTEAQILGADASGKYREQLVRQSQATRQAALDAGLLVAADDDVKTAQQAVTQAQQDYQRSLDTLNPRLSQAGRLAQGLRTAMQDLYGPMISATEANEGYEASWDGLSESVGKNKRSLDIHTAAGRANRDALEGLVTSTNEAYLADIAAGTAIDAARVKHDNRIKSIKEEARRLGLNRAATQELINTYGQIPKNKTTNLLITGINKIADTLVELYVYQRSLAEGIPLASARAALKNAPGPDKKFGGYHTGGYTGAGGKYEPAGVVHREEFVLRKESTSKIRSRHPGLLEEMNATGQVQGYASGGLVAPVEGRGLLYRTNVGVAKVPSKEQVAAKVAGMLMGSLGSWPSSPSAQRGDSGVWRRVVALIRSTGPYSGSFGNGYRAGDPLWHGSGRAVDWMGFNQNRLATFLAGRRPLELIHRTNSRDYAYTRGVNKGSFNESLMNAHRNHIHIAMQNGGWIPEPVFGYGRSGRTYSFAENGRPERVLSAGQSAATAGATVTIAPVININGASRSPREIAREVNREIGRTVDIYARSAGS